MPTEPHEVAVRTGGPIAASATAAPSVTTGGAAPDLTQAIRDRVRRIVGCTNPAPCAICERAAEIIELDLAAVTRQRDDVVTQHARATARLVELDAWVRAEVPEAQISSGIGALTVRMAITILTRQRAEARAALEPLEQALLAERRGWDDETRIFKKLTQWAKAIATVRDRLTDQGR